MCNIVRLPSSQEGESRSARKGDHNRMLANPRTTRVLFTAAWTMMGMLMLGSMAGNRATADETGISTNINDYVCGKIEDVTATVKIGSYDENEGRKINKDFGLIYKLKGDIRLRYKEENKLRLDAHIGASDATFIVNEATQYVRLGVGIKPPPYDL